MTIGIGILSATRRQVHIEYEPGISAAQLYIFLVRAVMKPQVFWIGYRLVALGLIRFIYGGYINNYTNI